MTQSNSVRKESVAVPVAPAPDAPATLPIHKRSLLQWIKAAFPTVLVIVLLGGVAVWGRNTDWTLPKFSELFGGGAENKTDWCEEHNVPESQCIECNKNLITPVTDYGWCETHGIAECPLDHPDVAQLPELPVVSEADLQRAHRALALIPRDENNRLCKMYEKRIQFASAAAVDKAGISVVTAGRGPIIEALSANGQVTYDETRTAHLASRVAGTVWRMEKFVGDQVQKGDVLALIEAAEVGRLKAQLLQAISQSRLSQINYDRIEPLAKDGAVAGKSLRNAEAELQQAQISLLSAQQALVNVGLPVDADAFAQMSIPQIAKRIQFLGLSESLTAKFDKVSTTSNLFPLRSPLDGVVVDSKKVAGEIVDTQTMMFEITDLRHVWLMLDVRQDDARHLSLGQPVLFRQTDNKVGPEIRGAISWISTEADDKTRTVKVRVDLPNSDWNLRANAFGLGRIVLREEPNAVLAPSEAIHSDGDCHVVFVRDKNYLKDGAPKFFHVREVRVGAKTGDMTEIIAGVLPGEVVADKNSAVLEAQLLKGNMSDDD